MAEDLMTRALGVLSTTSGCVGVGTVALVSAASAAYLLSTEPEPILAAVDYSNQSVILEGGIYADQWTVDNGQLMEYFYEDAKTVYEAFLRGKRLKGDGNFLGARTGPNREYEWVSYNETHERMQAFGSGLIKLGVPPGQKSFLGIFAQNRPEWVIADQTCQMYSMVTVALYDTLGSDAVIYVINLCEITTVVCDTEERAKLVLENKEKMKSLQNIIMIEALTPQLHEAAKLAGVKILGFTDVEDIGKENLQEAVPPQVSDISTICFTSGTTGDPKGAILSHRNIMSDIAAVTHRLREKFALLPTDAHLSYLPLAHMYERINIVNLQLNGASVGFYSRDIQLLFNDLQTLKPTNFPTVPRLLNKIRDKVLAGTASSKIKSWLFQLCLSNKLKEVRRSVIRRDSLWDRLVFGKIQAFLGGNVKFISTGSAPLSGEVFDFARCAFGCLVFEAYGQTEAAAAVTMHNIGDPTPGHVGSPLPCNYVKLIDVPEMEYYAKDGIGEVCVKGSNVMSGYYRSPEKTKEAFTEDGWLRTGDVGSFNENGTLTIMDRCKHIFKLQQGEYIAPEKIEAIYTRSKYIQQCFVDGDSMKTRCMAMAVPDPDFVLPWAANNSKGKDIEALCHDQDLKEIVLADLRETGKKAGLKGFEQVLDIALEPQPFSLESGLLTPTFKNKRPQLRRHFALQMADLYVKNADKL